jgi:serine/threonine protein phosphatase 1
MSFSVNKSWLRQIRSTLGATPRAGWSKADPLKPARAAFAPAGRVFYVIGDIHGRADLLEDLLNQIIGDAERLEDGVEREIIFLGDYVDRGPDSRLVIDMVLAARSDRRFAAVTALKGNHEDALLRFLRDANVWPVWSQYGAHETLIAYGVAPPPANGNIEQWALARLRLEAAIPPDHLAFLEGLELSATRGDYFFVHAGVRPGVPLEHQSERDMLSIRDEFITCPEPFDKVVVHGHTVGEPYLGANRIALDTGAYASGVLTAIKLKDGERTLLQTRPVIA